MRTIIVVIACCAAIGVLAVLLWPRAEPTGPVVSHLWPLPSICADTGFEGDAFVVCTVDPQKETIEMRLRASDGKPIERLERVEPKADMVFSMNGGMYHEDLSPVGLYVEDGVILSPLNQSDGTGNFFMKPNGVFFVDHAGAPHVTDTDSFARATPEAEYATQSGPMLVIDGQVHPRFEVDGASQNVRNGVGVDSSGRAVFAISRGPVSFGKFARLMRDGLGCRNALYLDGAISALHDGTRYIVGGKHPVGPVIIVRKRASEHPSQ